MYFRIVLKNTDYFGPDLDFTMTMNVQDEAHVSKPTIEEELEKDIAQEYDSSDEDEDESDVDDEDESDSDYTDIDTDTEAESDSD